MSPDGLRSPHASPAPPTVRARTPDAGRAVVPRRRHRPLVPRRGPGSHDAAARRWLGGPDWPRQMLEHAGDPLGEFRGAIETGRYRWIAYDDGRAVGFIDCATYDRWATWEGGTGGRGVVSVIDVPSAGFAYVVDPALRHRGHCTAMIAAMPALPELAHIELFAAGVEPDNTGSVACLRKGGFRP